MIVLQFQRNIIIIVIVVGFIFLVVGQDASETTTTVPLPDLEGVDNSPNITKKLLFNFPIMNRTDIEKNCTALPLGKCWSSDWFLPICASNTIVYQNPGVLVCAQVCSPEIELEVFCDPNGKDVDELQWCKKCPEKIAQTRKVSAAANASSVDGTDVVEGEDDGAVPGEEPIPSDQEESVGEDDALSPNPEDDENGANNNDDEQAEKDDPPQNEDPSDVPPMDNNDVDTDDPVAESEKSAKKKKKHSKKKDK